MPDDIKSTTPDIKDELWAEQEPDTQPVTPTGEPIAPRENIYHFSGPSEPAIVSEKFDEVVKHEIDTPAIATPESQPSSQYIAVGPNPTQKPKKAKWIIAVCIAACLSILAGGGAYAYYFWYQNPDKALSDALVHAMQAKSLTYNGSFASDVGGAKLTISFDGNHPTSSTGQVSVHAAFAVKDQTVKLDGSGIVDATGTTYVKLNNVRSAVNALAAQIGVKATSFDTLITKVDDKWIKVTPDDLKQVYQVAGDSRTCSVDVFKKLKSDKAQQKELTDLYQKHTFITVEKKLGSSSVAGVQSLGYQLTGDVSQLKQFVGELNNTKLAQALKTCDASFTFKADDISNDVFGSKDTNHFQVWVSQWGHDFTRISLDGVSKANQKSSFLVEPHFNKAMPIQTPTNAITVQQLQGDMQAAYEGLMVTSSQSSQEQATTAQAHADALSVLKHIELYNANKNVYPTLAQLKAGASSSDKLPADLSSRVVTVKPSAANPLVIQYQLCTQSTGAYVSYFDMTTTAVVQLTAGICNS